MPSWYFLGHRVVVIVEIMVRSTLLSLGALGANDCFWCQDVSNRDKRLTCDRYREEYGCLKTNKYLVPKSCFKYNKHPKLRCILELGTSDVRPVAASGFALRPTTSS